MSPTAQSLATSAASHTLAASDAHPIRRPITDPVTSNPTKAAAIWQASQMLQPYLMRGEPLDAKILRHAMEDAHGASDASGAWVWKDAYEATEIAQAQLLAKFGPAMLTKSANPAEFLAMIERIAALIPSQTRRSEESQKLQQFSTPLPLSAVVAHLAAITSSDLVLEPSAGTGLLASFAAIRSASLALNELAPVRAELLRQLFPNTVVTTHDASTINDRLDRSIAPTVILMNPPFSAAPKVEGKYKQATSQHVLSALARLENKGRLVLVSGANFNPTNPAFKQAFERISEISMIMFSAPILGKVFARHGTTIDTRLTVIDKTSVSEPVNHEAYFPICESTSDLLDLAIRACPKRASFEGDRPDAARQTTPIAKQGSAQSVLARAKESARKAASDKARHPFDAATTVEIDYSEKVNQLEDGDAASAGTATISNDVYETYQLSTITIANGGEHPTPLVQSAAMAASPSPMPIYRPKLIEGIVENGVLSAPQAETVIYAGEAHSHHLKGHFVHSENYGEHNKASEDKEGAFRLRRGFFLGDGTGCGKGRQVAGIIQDNWLNGRRRSVWVSKSDKLIEDARRDWMALGGRESDVVSLSKYKQGTEIRLGDGILFVTYATLRSAEREDKISRLEQIVNWLGSEFEGVIAFDEGHALANAAGSKSDRGDTAASQQGRAGLHLQALVPDARIVYVSATGATEVNNLAYASRLGLWQTGDFPFATRSDFVTSMEEGGIAAMEIISRDLKALGLYIARSLSYDGVEYEMLTHELSPDQIEIYDSYADAFQIIHSNLDKALEAAGVTSNGAALDKRAKSAARSAFESSKQRFFSHLITAMKCLSLIASIKADLEAGHSPVVQVVSTSEALMERRLAEIPPSEWDDLHVDITPREYVMDYLVHSFPVQLYEPFTDEDGNMRSRPVYDDAGNQVMCRAAEEARDKLIEHLGSLPAVQSALDQIIWTFGKSVVAEVTGRSRRIIRTSEEKLKVERRPASSNLSETQSFMDDTKRILVFSDAGGTGRSYHADLGCVNQRLRVHYLLEPGWKADNAIQGLGRTNRTNQAQPPLFRPCATNVQGEKRFISTIARRLDTLGAITKGQRETGGQNMFRAEDNLESDLARAALRRFYSMVKSGSAKSCSLLKFEEMTGLKLTDQAGSLLEKLPPIHTFLNRCLALRIAMQNQIFAEFGELLSANIENARRAGTLDMGLETLRAEKFVILSRDEVYQHPQTGAVAEALTIERTDRNHPMGLDKVKHLCANVDGSQLYINDQSGRVALALPTSSWMDDDGLPIARVELIRPMTKDMWDELDLIKSNWREATDGEFEGAWVEEFDAVPKFSTSKIILVCGLLLPIWDKLPNQNPRVRRLQTEDGTSAVGRLLSIDHLATVYGKLGLHCDIVLSPSEVIETVMEKRQGLTLAGSKRLHRSLLMGKARLELSNFEPSELDGLKAIGCFTELVQWKTRLFIPFDNDAVLDKVLDAYPISAAA